MFAALIDIAMETTKISFCHPVKGKVFIKSKDGRVIKTMTVSSNKDFEIVIPLTGFAAGLWHLVFEWSYNDNFFSINRNVLI